MNKQAKLNNELLQACKDNNYDRMEELINLGAIPDMALIWSSRFGKKKRLLFLLDHGANPNCQDDMGATPIMWSSYSDSVIIANILRDRGADINYPDSESGASPLMWWIINSSCDLDKIENLVKHGADVIYRDVYGKIASDYATETRNLDVAEYLKKCEQKQYNLNNSINEIYSSILKTLAKHIKGQCTLDDLKAVYDELTELIHQGGRININMIKSLKVVAKIFQDNEMLDLCSRVYEYNRQKSKANATQLAFKRMRAND